MKRRLRRGPIFGTSLVEAVVALAVMAFGMLAVVGIQSTLRLNADVAKQRSDAVRIAQEAMEDARGFSAIEAANGQSAYADIIDETVATVPGYTKANTTYTLTRTVVDRTGPDRKEVSVQVAWTDRNDQRQSVELISIIGANDPRVARALGAEPRGIPERQPMGRHPAIPRLAQPLQDGQSSAFKPSADEPTVWVFHNLTGVITSVCTFPGTDLSALIPSADASCFAQRLYLLSGFVRFSVDGPPASEQPGPIPDLTPPLDLRVRVSLIFPSVATVACIEQILAGLDAVTYYCAVPVSTGPPQRWSGRVELFGNFVIAADLATADDTKFKICRYTPGLTHTPAGGNKDHPLDYVDVEGSLVNQNFLVISAGDGVTPYACPVDDTSTPLINGNTFKHQPLT